MKRTAIIILLNITFLFLFNSCKKNTFYLENKADKDARFVVIYYPDSIFLDYNRHTDKTENSGALIRNGDEYWDPKIKEKAENGLINIGAPMPENVFLSKKEYRFQIINDEALINDSILIYSENGKYVTRVIANNRPTEKIYYYDGKFHIDSIVWIIKNDSLAYK